MNVWDRLIYHNPGIGLNHNPALSYEYDGIYSTRTT